MRASTAFDYFGSMVESYDSLIARAVPRYQEMTERLLDYLPENAQNILELGCGTGNLSLRLAGKYPIASITFVDAAPEMIDLTRTRMAESHPQAAKLATFISSRFEDLLLQPNSFDVITSCISLHHVQDKASLYLQLFKWLKPGGTFRFADQLRGGTAWNHDLNWRRWLEFCAQPGHCTPEEIQSLLDHATAHDHYTPLLEHFQLLARAGFKDMDCVWRNWIWGIITAEKSRGS